MKLKVIKNVGPDNLRDTLKATLLKASDVRIAVAFVTQTGLNELLQNLRQVAIRGSVKLLTGLYQKVTEPQALRTLLRVQQQKNGRFSVRLSTEPQFHRKLYLPADGKNLTVFIGSSNFTLQGLYNSGEMNLLLRLPNMATAAKSIRQAFDEAWVHRAARLDADQIARYAKMRPQAPINESLSSRQLAEILGGSKKKRAAVNPESQHSQQRYWRDLISGYVKKRTELVISETTNWSEKGFTWFAQGGAHPYKIGDKICLFDFPSKTLRLASVKDVAHTKMSTPDGRHFVAYTLPRTAGRRFSNQLWKDLAEEGINRRNSRVRRKLGIRMAERLVRLIRVKKRKTSANRRG